MTSVAYDVELADRIGELLITEPEVTERRMFGGLAFLVGGHMAVVASREGGLLLRLDPASATRYVGAGEATQAVMGGREMAGWVRVPAIDVVDDAALGAWVDRALTFVSTLPPKG